MMKPLDYDAMVRELHNLKTSYRHHLDMLQQRLNESVAKLDRGKVTTHDPFNMSATTQELAVLAGKIEQTENVVRWMDAK